MQRIPHTLAHLSPLLLSLSLTPSPAPSLPSAIFLPVATIFRQRRDIMYQRPREGRSRRAKRSLFYLFPALKSVSCTRYLIPFCSKLRGDVVPTLYGPSLCGRITPNSADLASNKAELSGLLILFRDVLIPMSPPCQFSVPPPPLANAKCRGPPHLALRNSTPHPSPEFLKERMNYLGNFHLPSRSWRFSPHFFLQLVLFLLS